MPYLGGSRSTICIGKSIGGMGLCRISEVPLWEVYLFLQMLGKLESSVIHGCRFPNIQSD